MIYSDLNSTSIGIKYKGLGIQCIKNGLIRWVQPIIILQDVYGNSAINEWDGEAVVDKEKNQILAAMVGAGYKDEITRLVER